MNPPKCDDLNHVHFLIAAQKVFTCTEAARCAPEGAHPPAHEAFTRLLQRQPPDTKALWQEAKAHVNLRKGLLHPGPTLRPEDGSGDLPRER
jgi:putative transposase